jgi:AcrR family transcriptional regulator
MAADEVAAHQRSRLQAAMVELAGGEGYEAVTVRRLAQIAGVSTRTFYEHFQGKDECLLSACDLIVQHVVEQLRTLRTRESNWRERLRCAVVGLAGGVAEQAPAARLVLIEAPTAGLGQPRSFEEIVGAEVRSAFSDVDAPPILLKGVMAGILSVVQSRLIAEREQELPELVDELVAWALALVDVDTEKLALLDRRINATERLSESTSSSMSEWTVRVRRADDRPLLLAAASRLATVQNHRQLTASKIRAAAGVSRRSFDSHFGSAGECVQAALESRVLDAFASAVKEAPGRSWEEDICSTISSLCAQFSRDPLFASLATERFFADGPLGGRGENGLKLFAAERFRASTSSPRRPGQATAEASVGSVWALLRSCASRSSRQISRMAPWSIYFMLAPALGPQTALSLASGRS